jgi:hypothetical protein
MYMRCRNDSETSHWIEIERESMYYIHLRVLVKVNRHLIGKVADTVRLSVISKEIYRYSSLTRNFRGKPWPQDNKYYCP